MEIITFLNNNILIIQIESYKQTKHINHFLTIYRAYLTLRN
jgi:hypothetical protein